MSATLALDDDEYSEEWEQQPQTAAAVRETVADLQLLDEQGAVSRSYELRVGDNVIGRDDHSDVALTDDATVSNKHACIAIELPAAFVTASSLAAPFLTTSGSLLDLDAITVTDLNSSNHTRLLSATATAAQPPIRLQPNKPRVLRHRQLLQLGKQRCRFVLRQYELGIQRAKERSALPAPADVSDPNATQAYYEDAQQAEGGEQVDDQATLAYNDDLDDHTNHQPPAQRNNSAYNDSPDDEPQHHADADNTQHYPAADDAQEEAGQGQDEPMGTQPYSVEVDKADDAQRQDGEGVKAGSEEYTSIGSGSESSPIIMSLASSHSSNANEDEDEEDQLPLSQLAHSHSNATDGAGNKKASARTRGKQPSLVVTAEEQRSSMEEEEREKRRQAEEESDRRLRRQAEEEKAAFDREVQQKAKQREEKRRQEETEERTKEEQARQQREQQEAEKKRQSQLAEQERVRREAKEKREAEKREKARRAREEQDEQEEERERKRVEAERQKEEERQKADEEAKRAEEAAAAAAEEAKREKEAEEVARAEQLKHEEEERQRQSLVAEKQRLQQIAASQSAWKSKPSKKVTQQPSTPSPKKKASDDNKATPPRGEANVKKKKESGERKQQRPQADVEQSTTPPAQHRAEEKSEAGEGDKKKKSGEQKEPKSRRGKLANAGDAKDKQQAETEPSKRPSRRKPLDAGQVIPITQPAEEQWDAGEFSPAGEDNDGADVQMAQLQTENGLVDAHAAEEAEPENPAVTTAEEPAPPAVVPVQDEAPVQRASSRRDKRKRANETETTPEPMPKEGRHARDDDEKAQKDADQDADTKLRLEAEEQKAAFEREVQQKAEQQEEKRMQEVEEKNGRQAEPEPAAASASGLQQHPTVATTGLHATDKPPNASTAGSPVVVARGKPSARKRVRRANNEEEKSAGHDSATTGSTSAELQFTAEQPSAQPHPASVDLSARSPATQAAMDVLEDMDVAQALAGEGMPSTDEEVSPASAAAAPKKRRGRPKKTISTKAAPAATMDVETANAAASEGKRAAGRGKRKLEASVADEISTTDERSPRYSHRTRSTGTVDNQQTAADTAPTTATPTHATRRSGSKPATPPQAAARTSSCSSSSNTVSSPATSAPVLLFTAVDHSSYNADIERLHGTVTTDPHAATHLVTSKVRRTDKFLIAYSITPHLQSLHWLEHSLRQQRWQAEEQGRLTDAEAEAKWAFALSERRVASRWMAGWQVWCSDGVVPGRASMRGIVEAAGGRMREVGVEGVKTGREAEKEKVVVIGCEADKAACIEWTRAGYTVYDKEILLSGVLRQRIEPEQHVLYKPAVATAAAAKAGAKGRKR